MIAALLAGLVIGVAFHLFGSNHHGGPVVGILAVVGGLLLGLWLVRRFKADAG